MEGKSTIVITGGAGFIGSGLVRQLNEQGHERLLIVDHLGKSGKWKNLVGKAFLDVIEKEELWAWLEKYGEAVSAIFHLGACSSTVETDASYLLENNYRYSVRLAEFALKADVRFIYASSAATYGDGSEGFSDKGDIRKLRPLNMYGYSKQLFDLWLQRQGLFNKVVGLKYFNVFGPNEGHKGRMASAIVHMMPVILQEGRVSLFKSNSAEFKDGEQCRDFIYVKDAVRMTAAFLTNSAHGLFNIGTGIASSWNSLAHALFSSTEKPPRIEYTPLPLDLEGKYQNYTCAEMSKTRAALGEAITQCQSLDSSVCDYVKNYLLIDRLW